MARLTLIFLAALQTLPAQSHGYLFFGPGGVTSGGYTSGSLYMGGGGEGIFGAGIGAGVEIGYTAPWRQFSSGTGIASANGSFHFRRSGPLVPFVTSGYTLFFRSGHANGFNFGGGVNWWFSRRLGLKTEFRDHVGLGSLHDAHFWVIRAGLNFR